MPLGEPVLLTLRLPGTLTIAATRALQAGLRQAQDVSLDHRRAQKVCFANFDAALDRASPGPRHFENEKIAEALAGEIMMLEETGFVVHRFTLMPNHAHLGCTYPPGAAWP